MRNVRVRKLPRDNARFHTMLTSILRRTTADSKTRLHSSVARGWHGLGLLDTVPKIRRYVRASAPLADAREL